MKIKTLHTEVFDVVCRHLEPKVASSMIKEIKRVDAFERTITGGREKPDIPKNGSMALADRDKIDRLFTICFENLESEDGLRVMLEVGDVFRDRGELARAEEVYTMAITQCDVCPDSVVLGDAYLRRGDVYGRLGRWKESSSDLSRSRTVYLDLDDEGSIGKVENALGTNFAGQGKLKQAQTCFKKALASFEQHEDILMTGCALMNLGIVYNIMGDYDQALAQYRRAQPYFERLGDMKKLGDLHHNTGMSYLFKRDYKTAVAAFDRCASLCVRTQSINLMGLASLGKANAYFQMHDMRLALNLVNEALQYFSISNDRLSIADAYKVKGMIHREMKKYSFAMSFLQTSLRINQELKNMLNTGETLYELGLLEATQGNVGDGIARLGDALVCFKKVGARDEVKRTEEQLAALQPTSAKAVG